MTHIWLRAESRPDEARSPLTPEGAARLLARGMTVTVERSPRRVFPDGAFAAAGCAMRAAGDWREAPEGALILGLKELPAEAAPLRHRHIMFGHAFKGQHAGQDLLRRFKAGGGALLDLEYLTDAAGRRLAAFGYWAGYVGAAVSLIALAAQRRGAVCPAVTAQEGRAELLAELQRQGAMNAAPAPRALIIGALGRVGRGAADLCAAAGVPVTAWDMAETAQGGPFPEILEHELFFNCILARPGTPRFVGPQEAAQPRALRVIGDIACDPDSDYNPVPLYTAASSWEAPVHRVAEAPPLDIMAIDNLPSLLPRESSEDFAKQLLPLLERLDEAEGAGPWTRARAEFETHIARL